MYDKLSKSWIQRNSKPQPFLNVTVQTCDQDYSDLDLDDHKVSSLAASIPALADTGCQSCLTELKVVQRLGLREEQRIPVTLRMHGASNDGIIILGALLLRISCVISTGQTVATKHMTYVTDSSDKLFLSREACTTLGIIPDNFPCAHASAFCNIDSAHKPSVAPCGCPTRQLPPPSPASLPFPATEENRHRLNTCLIIMGPQHSTLVSTKNDPNGLSTNEVDGQPRCYTSSSQQAST